MTGLQGWHDGNLDPKQTAAKDHVEMDFASRSRRWGNDRRSEMNARLGELVRVNAAAFTGARFANRESIPCDVLEFRDRRVRVQTRFPYRVFSAWISAEWIEEPVGAAEPAAALAAE